MNVIWFVLILYIHTILSLSEMRSLEEIEWRRLLQGRPKFRRPHVKFCLPEVWLRSPQLKVASPQISTYV